MHSKLVPTLNSNIAVKATNIAMTFFTCHCERRSMRKLIGTGRYFHGMWRTVSPQVRVPWNARMCQYDRYLHVRYQLHVLALVNAQHHPSDLGRTWRTPRQAGCLPLQGTTLHLLTPMPILSQALLFPPHLCYEAATWMAQRCIGLLRGLDFLHVPIMVRTYVFQHIFNVSSAYHSIPNQCPIISLTSFVGFLVLYLPLLQTPLMNELPWK